MPRPAIARMPSSTGLDASSVSGSAVMIAATGSSGLRPCASTRLRRSRSVTIPQTRSPSLTSTDETPCCDMLRAASAIVVCGITTIGSERTSSPIGVMNRVCPDELRGCRAEINRSSRLRM